MNLETSIYMKIILTENDIKQMVKKSVRKILKEDDNILNNIMPEQVLEIINNATNNKDFEIVDSNLECTTPLFDRFGFRPWSIDFEGKLYIGFYGDGHTMVQVQVNVDAWLERGGDEDVDYQKQTGVEIKDVELVEFYDGETYTTINMGNMLNQVDEIINSDIVYKKLNNDISYTIEHLMSEREEEYEDYLDY